MHLPYVLTGEMTPCTNKLITYLSDPVHNEDPEPYSKKYSAGGADLAHHNLEQNLTKRQKTQHNLHVAHIMNPPTLTTPNSTTLAEHTSNTINTNNDPPKTDM